MPCSYLVYWRPKLSSFHHLYLSQAKRGLQKTAYTSLERVSLALGGEKESLFHELFPEEKLIDRTNGALTDVECEDHHVPRLYLSDIEGVDGDWSLGNSGQKTEIASATASAFRLWDLAILVLSRASKSLLDDDFRRIAPQGRHIDDWRGPGDIVKVIPVRHPSSLEQIGRYYVLFPNPPCARAYQNKAIQLNRFKQLHTPTSFASQNISFQSSDSMDEEPLSTSVDYALSSSSSGLHLKSLPPPFHSSVRHVLNARGYPHIMEPCEKTNRAILFWVEGSHFTTNQLKQAIEKDGRNRGASWKLDDRKDAVQKLGISSSRDTPLEDLDQEDQGGSPQKQSPRWMLTFENEAEARRFVRSWHNRAIALNSDTVTEVPFANCHLLW